MNRLKELRKQKKQTQKELALELEVPLRTLQSWENGESNIKPDKAQILADHFGVSVGYLLGYSDRDKHPFDWDEISMDSKPYLIQEIEREKQKRANEIHTLRDFAKNNDLTENIDNVAKQMGEILLPYLNLNVQLRAKKTFSDSEKTALKYLENQVLHLNSAFAKTLLKLYKTIDPIDEYQTMKNVLNFLEETDN